MATDKFTVEFRGPRVAGLQFSEVQRWSYVSRDLALCRVTQLLFAYPLCDLTEKITIEFADNIPASPRVVHTVFTMELP